MNFGAVALNSDLPHMFLHVLTIRFLHHSCIYNKIRLSM
jgi:hypothetical protein